MILMLFDVVDFFDFFKVVIKFFFFGVIGSISYIFFFFFVRIFSMFDYLIKGCVVWNVVMSWFEVVVEVFGKDFVLYDE